MNIAYIFFNQMPKAFDFHQREALSVRRETEKAARCFFTAVS